jgi:hypothetical protein
MILILILLLLSIYIKLFGKGWYWVKLENYLDNVTSNNLILYFLRRHIKRIIKYIGTTISFNIRKFKKFYFTFCDVTTFDVLKYSKIDYRNFTEDEWISKVKSDPEFFYMVRVLEGWYNLSFLIQSFLLIFLIIFLFLYIKLIKYLLKKINTNILLLYMGIINIFIIKILNKNLLLLYNNIMNIFKKLKKKIKNFFNC